MADNYIGPTIIKMGLSDKDISNVEYIHKNLEFPELADSVSWAVNLSSTLLRELNNSDNVILIKNEKTGITKKINIIGTSVE